ncbi:ABC transporter ATP-binding protein [Alicyclobacillus suci]|uniref:ABC transporter ATP-binding protein n=1 Tax=Alicyclobacillus suci TaxID=2816080 RepID=UPI001A8F8686|nr:ABC transporter ATP-binding protein [Alicyclobacillus suci]
MSVLTLEHVSKTIGRRLIVDDVNMAVEPGEVYGFLGPNGAGKTTTIRMIVGLIRPTKGSIRVMGHDISRDRRAALSHVGAIVENPETYSYLTARQNLVHYARLAGIPHAKRRIEEVVDLVGLTGRVDDKVKRYSLGMRQRLGVAQALLANPKLLVLDEPTNGLDPAGIREFREMIRNLAQGGMSVLVSSHLLSEIQMMCDRVAILKGGRIIAQRSVSSLVDGTASAAMIRVSNENAAVRVLKDRQWDAEVSAAHVIRVRTDGSAIPKLIRDLVRAEIDIYAVEPARESLEEAFLELTDDKLASSSTPAGGVAHA